MTALSRIAPAFTFGSWRARFLIERNVYVYRRTYMTLLSGFFEPLFYLLAMGFGLGALIGQVPGPDGHPISYTAFIAPALLAASAMNGAVYDSTFNVFFRLNYEKVYNAVLATPLGVGDVALGEIIWALIRGQLYAIGFMVVVLLLGLVPSFWGLLAVPASVLLGFAAAGLGMAATSFMKTWQDLDLVQLVVLPVFLFSGTFYPLSVYPEPFRTIIQFSPLYRGTDLIRRLTTGALDPVMLVDAAYLVLLGVLGLTIVSRRLDKLLLK
ncbi:MAG TPA: ABC transporter permease [Candidatus Limnocylindrales bacterium]